MDLLIGLGYIFLGFILVAVGIHGIRFLLHRQFGTYYVSSSMTIDQKTGLVRGTRGYWKNLK